MLAPKTKKPMALLPEIAMSGRADIELMGGSTSRCRRWDGVGGIRLLCAPRNMCIG